MPKLQERSYYNFKKDERGAVTKESVKNPKLTYTLTIPLEIIKKKEWKKHDFINVRINEKGEVILEKAF